MGVALFDSGVAFVLDQQESHRPPLSGRSLPERKLDGIASLMREALMRGIKNQVSDLLPFSAPVAFLTDMASPQGAL